jgi:cell division protein FtsB
MPDSKRPDPRRRTPASRPGKAGKSGEATRGRSRGASPVRRESRPAPPKTDEPEIEEIPAEERSVLEPVRRAIVESAERQTEQRLGSAARRAAILAALICILTLTIAGPVRTYFAQRAEMNQLKEAEAQLRSQIADLEQQKEKLGDPVFIAAQARERLGFVMPGDIPYQVQLPNPVGPQASPEQTPTHQLSGQPWYTSLWHTIADTPHGLAPPPVAPPAPPGPAPVPPPGPVPGG